MDGSPDGVTGVEKVGDMLGFGDDNDKVEPNIKKETKEKMVFDDKNKTKMGGEDITGSINNSMLEVLRGIHKDIKKGNKQQSGNLVQ